MNKTPLLVIAGPTAAGKSALSLDLAERLDGEIISADSVQVYRYMDIGSAKITKEEMRGIPHHLIDILDPKEAYNAVLFQAQAKAAIEEIRTRGKLPIVCGGTGFYLRALIYDTAFTEEETDEELREALLKEAETKEGQEELYRRLQEADPEYAEGVSPNNIRRVIRALEFYTLTGKKLSEHNRTEREKESPYDLLYLCTTWPRETLYQRIDARVDGMMDAGLLDEVRFLKDYGCTRGMTSMQALGYKQLYAHLAGERTLNEAVEDIKKETRHFAKRQMTWFRAEKDVRFIDMETTGAEDVQRIWNQR